MLRHLFAAFLLAAATLAAAQESATTSRATDLKDKGAAEARTVASLPEGTAVKVTQRAGGWARVEANGQSGWVRVFHLRFATTAETTSSGGAGGFLSSLGSALGGSRQTAKSTTIATVGIRGLSPEDLKNATPDAEALRKVQSYRADRSSAERFAKEGMLAESRVDYAEGRR